MAVQDKNPLCRYENSLQNKYKIDNWYIKEFPLFETCQHPPPSFLTTVKNIHYSLYKSWWPGNVTMIFVYHVPSLYLLQEKSPFIFVRTVKCGPSAAQILSASVFFSSQWKNAVLDLVMDIGVTGKLYLLLVLYLWVLTI